MLRAYYQVTKFRENNKGQIRVTKRGRQRISRSFVKGFLGLLYTNATNNSATLNDISNAQNTQGNYAVNLSVNAGGGNGAMGLNATYGTVIGTGSYAQDLANIGIVVGSGDNAVATTDYALETKIAEGTGEGTLEHFGHHTSIPTTTGSDASFYIERIFRNSSGAAMTISEAGIYALGGSATAARPYCIIRDVLDPVVSFDDAEYLKVKYTLKITV